MSDTTLSSIQNLADRIQHCEIHLLRLKTIMITQSSKLACSTLRKLVSQVRKIAKLLKNTGTSIKSQNKMCEPKQRTGDLISQARKLKRDLKTFKMDLNNISECCGRKGEKDILAAMRSVSKIFRKATTQGDLLCNHLIREARIRKSLQVQSDEKNICSICVTNKKCIVFIPCGHLTCNACSIVTSKCHFCRTAIVGKYTFYE